MLGFTSSVWPLLGRLFVGRKRDRVVTMYAVASRDSASHRQQGCGVCTFKRPLLAEPRRAACYKNCRADRARSGERRALLWWRWTVQRFASPRKPMTLMPFGARAIVGDRLYPTLVSVRGVIGKSKPAFKSRANSRCTAPEPAPAKAISSVA